MCGIFGAISKDRHIVDLLLKGLNRLEYRGYDSCGIAILNEVKGIESRKSNEKVENLQRIIKSGQFFDSHIGIAHTRWATHGVPSIKNAHPLYTKKVAVVHNGIIENHVELRTELEKQEIIFHTDTDTEVIPNLITTYLDLGCNPEQAVSKSLEHLYGTFAVVVLFAGYDNLLIAARKGMSLAVGCNQNTRLVASDTQTLSLFTQEISCLEDNDIAKITKDRIEIINNSVQVTRGVKKLYNDYEKKEKENYPCFMFKEIHEQPKVIERTVKQFFTSCGSVVMPQLCHLDFISKINFITIIGCGSSYFAGLIAKYWLESLAKIRVYIEIASEFRYIEAKLEKGGIMLFISQSGETADTLEALRYAKQQDQCIISLTNVPGNSMEQLSDITLNTLAGIEVGVASTKTFSSQLSVLACFTAWLAQVKGIKNNIINLYSIKCAHQYVKQVLDIRQFKVIVDTIIKYNQVIIIGRGVSYGVALEGALKIKELSYINAIGIAAGEMKHGSIALIDENMPVVVIAPYDNLFLKMLSNVQEVAARKGKVIALTDCRGKSFLENLCYEIILLPEVDRLISPIVYTIPLQLMAYFIAVKKGLNADQPRNLAKSVTVE